MIEEAGERLLNGVLWGVGVGLAIRIARAAGGGGEHDEHSGEHSGNAVRPVAKNAMKGAIAVSDRMRSVLSEARESIEDLYAEAAAESHAQTPATNGHRPRPSQSRPAASRKPRATSRKRASTARNIPVEA